MTTGEWITIVITVGATLALVSTAGHYWANGSVGLKLLIIEVLLTGAVATACYYFMPDYDERVLEKRYRTQVIQEVWKCQEQCARTCLKEKDIGKKE